MSKPITLSREDLRKLQLTELEMLVEVDRICRKHGITYTLDGGTLLGAVRHKGFIPWDDDADIVFPRHEYAKFYRACKKDLDTERFFLQEYRTDPEYRWGYAKLRRKGTKYIRAGQEHLKYQSGVYIDLFPLDHVPDNFALRRIYYGVNFAIRKILYSELGKTAEKTKFMRAWYSLLNKIPRDLAFQARNRMAGLCNQKKTKLAAHTMYPNPGPECKYGMPASCYDEYMDLEFEGMRFMSITDYDRFLQLSYGDYMQLPPEHERVGHADASYIELPDITLKEIQERYYRENLPQGNQYE